MGQTRAKDDEEPKGGEGRRGRQKRRSGHTGVAFAHVKLSSPSHIVCATHRHTTRTKAPTVAHTLKLRGSVFRRAIASVFFGSSSLPKTPYAMCLSRDGSASARELGTLLRKALGAWGGVRVVFCPGMGGRGHADQFWYLWSQLGLEAQSWTRFAEGGQDFNSYKVGPGSTRSGSPDCSDARSSDVTRRSTDKGKRHVSA